MKLFRSRTWPFFLSLAISACSAGEDRAPEVRDMPVGELKKSVTIPQGAWGFVEFWEGDFMPTGEPNHSGGSITPATRTLYFYKPTTQAQVEQQGYGAFYRAIHTELVDSVRTDESGFYQIELPAGVYSVFVREDSLFYANEFWEDGIQIVRVLPDSAVEGHIMINYKAAY